MKTLFFVAFLLFAETIFGAEKRSLPCGDRLIPYINSISDRIILSIRSDSGMTVREDLTIKNNPGSATASLVRAYEDLLNTLKAKSDILNRSIHVEWSLLTEVVENGKIVALMTVFFGELNFVYTGEVPKLWKNETDLLSQYVPLKDFFGVKKVEVIRIYPGGQVQIASSARNGAEPPCIYSELYFNLVFIQGTNLDGNYHRKFGIKNNFKVYYSDDGSVYELYDENGDLVESTRPEDTISVGVQKYGDILSITVTSRIQGNLLIEESDDLKSWQEVSDVSLSSENRAEISRKVDPDKPSRYFRVRPGWRDKN